MSSKKSKNSFFRDIKYILRACQIFGLFPVSKLTSEDYRNIKFEWKSTLTVYSSLLVVSTLIGTVLTFIQLITHEFKLHSMDSFIFCFFASAITLAFYKLAMDWSELLLSFCETEIAFKNYSYHQNLRRRFTIMFVISTTGTLIEHSLAMATTYYQIDPQAISNNTQMELYFKKEYPFVFDHMEYSKPVALLLFMINNFNVFAWNFLDTFIMIISVTLVFRLKQISSRIKAGVHKKYISLYFWAKVREDYSLISELCQKVNDKIGHMILISFGSNMYFILSQLYKGLTIKQTIIDDIYFTFSFGIVILRLTGVILFGSEVHLQSQKPLRYLISLKSDYYNAEMATTIITYVLFMLQTKMN